MLLAPPGDDWLALCGEPLAVDHLAAWVVLPRCGAAVVFFGTVRDHSEGRPKVASLEYEAYADLALEKMRAVAYDLRRRWPGTGRVVLAHRTGPLLPTEVSVVVAVSAPHRAEAFDAARFGIDTIKTSVPIWKRETWEGGSSWGLDAHPIEPAVLPGPSGADYMREADHMSQTDHASQIGS
ncbi:MAG: molybdenum cofactor biosynthesis protein MoaE [Acidimicrobiales bacterium]